MNDPSSSKKKKLKKNYALFWFLFENGNHKGSRKSLGPAVSIIRYLHSLWSALCTVCSPTIMSSSGAVIKTLLALLSRTRALVVSFL